MAYSADAGSVRGGGLVPGAKVCPEPDSITDLESRLWLENKVV